MKLKRNTQISPGFLYLAPVLDVAFILSLLIVFSTSFLLQPGVAVVVPQSPFLLAPQKNPRVVSVTGPPKETIFYGNNEMSPGEFAAALKEEEKPGTLVVKADRAASYDLVLQVTNIGLEAGIPVVLATDPKR